MKKLALALFALSLALPACAAWPSAEATFPGTTFPGSLENYMNEEVRKAKPADLNRDSELTLRLSVYHLVKDTDEKLYYSLLNKVQFCGAIFIDNQGTLLIDKPCTVLIDEAFNAKKDKDELAPNGQPLGIDIELDKLGKYSSGENKGKPFFYAGTPAKNHFKKTKSGYTLFTIPLNENSPVKLAIQKLPALNTPSEKELPAIFKKLEYTFQKDLPAGVVEK